MAETRHKDILDMPVLGGGKKKEVAPSVDEMLAANAERLARLTLESIDIYTGRGLDGHVNEVNIDGLTTQALYITDELLEIPIWKQCATLGSIGAYVEYWNTVHPNEQTDADEVIDYLIKARLKYDPFFAFKMCFVIQDKVSGMNIDFSPNYAQIILIQTFERMRREGQPIRLILLKARQWGGSTATQLYMAWIQLFHKEGWNSVIIAQTKDTAKRIKAMYSRALRNFPAEIVYNTSKLQFSPFEKSTSDFIVTDKAGDTVRDNVITVASFENFEATRGASISMMHGSEVAYWTDTESKTAEDLITNISSNILDMPLTLEVLESTARGMSGYFYDEYQLAKEQESSREALFIPFFYIAIYLREFKSDTERRDFAQRLLDKRHDTTDTTAADSGEYLYSLWVKGATLESIHWYVHKRKSYHDHESMAQEFPSDDIECFKHSGHTIFSQYLIDKYRKAFAEEPVYKGDVMPQGEKAARLCQPKEDGELRIWQYPDHKLHMNDRYLSVVDVGGRGTKSDFSVITVVDRMPILFGGKAEVVARWRGHIRYDALADKAVLLSRYYNEAFLVFESNTFDKKDAQSKEFVYEGDHTRGVLSKVGDRYNNLYMRASTNPEDIKNGHFKKIGFQTNVKTKQDIIDAFIISFEDDTDFLDHDTRAYSEMSIYELRDDGTYGNIPGKNNHDDILMTDMIANFISQHEMPMPTVAQTEHHEEGHATINESYL